MSGIEMNVANEAFAMVTKTDGVGYILKETDKDGDDHYLVFVGSHNDLNLYQIWYNNENNLLFPLEVISSFAPIIRRKSDDKPQPSIGYIPKPG